MTGASSAGRRSVTKLASSEIATRDAYLLRSVVSERVVLPYLGDNIVVGS
jgi:hypothetical protein